MRLPKFEYRKPATIKEASAILSNEPGSRVLAGGTDLLVNMKHRVETPDVLVNIKGVAELDFIRREKGAARIGALTRLKRIAQSPIVADGAAALASAASHVGSYHHQVMGTIGGNLCQQNRCKHFNQSQMWRAAKANVFQGRRRDLPCGQQERGLLLQLLWGSCPCPVGPGCQDFAFRGGWFKGDSPGSVFFR